MKIRRETNVGNEDNAREIAKLFPELTQQNELVSEKEYKFSEEIRQLEKEVQQLKKSENFTQAEKLQKEIRKRIEDFDREMEEDPNWEKLQSLQVSIESIIPETAIHAHVILGRILLDASMNALCLRIMTHKDMKVLFRECKALNIDLSVFYPKPEESFDKYITKFKHSQQILFLEKNWKYVKYLVKLNAFLEAKDTDIRTERDQFLDDYSWIMQDDPLEEDNDLDDFFKFFSFENCCDMAKINKTEEIKKFFRDIDTLPLDNLIKNYEWASRNEVVDHHKNYGEGTNSFTYSHFKKSHKNLDYDSEDF